MSAAFKLAIVEAYGVAPDDIEPGRIVRFSRTGRRGDESAWCLLFADGRAGVFGDWRDGDGHQTWSERPRETMTPAERVVLASHVVAAKAERDMRQKAHWQEASRRNARLWGECQPVEDGDPVATYLRRRVGIDAAQVPGCIRLHPGLAYFNEGVKVGTWSAMVAALRGPDGRLLALHRTWLTPEGRKADTPGPVKKLTSAAGSLSGGCIRLGWPTPGGTLLSMGVAEGIETALAARQASSLPTAAAYSAHNLAAWQWPRGLRRLVIFADHDEAGQVSAARMRQRAQFAGLYVTVLTPVSPGADWCDVWAGMDAAGVTT